MTAFARDMFLETAFDIISDPRVNGAIRTLQHINIPHSLPFDALAHK